MYKIDDSEIHFAWLSDDLYIELEQETAYFTNMLTSEFIKEDFEKLIFTKDESPFFEKQIEVAMMMLFTMVTRVCGSSSSSFLINEIKSDLWNEFEESLLNGFSVTMNSDSSCNPLRLKAIDYDARLFIVNVILMEWFKNCGLAQKGELIQRKLDDIYVSLLCNLGYLRLNSYKVSYELTLQ